MERRARKCIIALTMERVQPDGSTAIEDLEINGAYTYVEERPPEWLK